MKTKHSCFQQKFRLHQLVLARTVSRNRPLRLKQNNIKLPLSAEQQRHFVIKMARKLSGKWICCGTSDGCSSFPECDILTEVNGAE